MTLWERFKKIHPIFQAAILMFPATLLAAANQWLLPNPPDYHEVVSRYYNEVLQSRSDVYNFVVIIPAKEELSCRWPYWAALIILLVLFRCFSKTPDKRIIWAAHIATAVPMVFATALWAKPHDYPVAVFAYGLIWGWLIFRTKNPFYSWMFHSASNAFSLVFIITGHYLFH